MIHSEPDPVHEWNLDSSWQDWPHGGLWNSPLDGKEPSPDADLTAIASATTAHPSPLTSADPPTYDVGRSLSELEPQ